VSATHAYLNDYGINLGYRTTDGGATWQLITSGGWTKGVDGDHAGNAVFPGGTTSVQFVNSSGTQTALTLAESNDEWFDVEMVSPDKIWVFGGGGAIQGSSAGTSVPDWVSGAGEWTNGPTGQFGVCVQDVAGASAFINSPTWLEDGGTCTANAADEWFAIPTATSKVAYTTGTGNTGRVDFVWGFRSGTSQAQGVYRATVLVEALSPNA
jgi:hypothetical protein